MAPTAMLQLTFESLCWSNYIVAKWFPTVELPELLHDRKL